MKIYLFVTVTIFGIAVSHTPTLAKSGTECSVIKENARRLLCYDLLFKIPGGELEKSVIELEDKKANLAELLSEWHIKKSVSKMMDTETVFITKFSTNQFFSKYGREKRASFSARCSENKTTMFFSFDGETMYDDEGSDIITLRIDKEKPFEKRFSESSNNKAVGLWSGGKAISFLKSLYKKQTLLVRFTPYQDSPKTVEFGIAEIENAIKPLAKACHWE